MILRLALLALAVYRVSMFAREDGPAMLFSRLREWLGKRAAQAPVGGASWTLAELANCPHCAGVWLSLFAALFVEWPLTTNYLLYALAIAGAQSFLISRSEN